MVSWHRNRRPVSPLGRACHHGGILSEDPSKVASPSTCAVSIAKGTALVVGKQKAKKGDVDYRHVHVATPSGDEARLTGWVAVADLQGKPGDKSVTLDRTVLSLFDKNPAASSFGADAAPEGRPAPPSRRRLSVTPARCPHVGGRGTCRS